MPSFAGHFQYLKADGVALQFAPCRVSFEAESLTLTPASGPPLAFDLGDVDLFAPGDYEITLTLYTGKRVVLSRFAKSFDNLRHDLLEAYRQRLLQCLLLEDLEEIARFDGFARLDSIGSPAPTWASPAEFRLFQSNLAVLPIAATGFQWRLADIDALSFDEANYAVILESVGRRLTVTKLAKRTGEFKERLENAISELSENSAKTLHGLFPFLTPDQFRVVAKLMKEGRAVRLAQLKSIHARTEQALVANVVDAKLKPYFDALTSQSRAGEVYTGFKLLRKDESEEKEAEQESVSPGAGAGAPQETLQAPPEIEEEGPAGAEAAKQPILHWFFFPLATKTAPHASTLVAWEATTKSGRATYFFRLAPPGETHALADPATRSAAMESGIRDLNRAIVMLNFRREPIYLPDDQLEIQPSFHRYAIACRKIPELRRLRASFLGRAIHTSPQAWEKQLDGFLEMA